MDYIVIVLAIAILFGIWYHCEQKKKSSFADMLNKSAFSANKTALQQAIESTQISIDSQKEAIKSINKLLDKAKSAKDENLIKSVTETLVSTQASIKASEDQLKALMSR